MALLNPVLYTAVAFVIFKEKFPGFMLQLVELPAFLDGGMRGGKGPKPADVMGDPRDYDIDERCLYVNK